MPVRWSIAVALFVLISWYWRRAKLSRLPAAGKRCSLIGHAQLEHGTLRAPFSDVECVAYEVSVQLRDGVGSTVPATLHETKLAPFVLNDADLYILVSATSFAIDKPLPPRDFKRSLQLQFLRSHGWPDDYIDRCIFKESCVRPLQRIAVDGVVHARSGKISWEVPEQDPPIRLRTPAE
jgi:hypothetical protein